MTPSLPYFSVIIVGAGPTGLAAGNLLGMMGIDTLILERNAGLSEHPKAISIDDEGLRICQAMGLHHTVMEHALLDVEAHYLSGKRLLARVAPTSKPNGFPLISTFHQPTLEAILRNGLKRYACVSIQFQSEAERFEQHDEGVIVTVKTLDEDSPSSRRIECAYLLACDGGKSDIRRTLGISMRGSTYAQKWLVIDTKQDPDTTTAIKFFCNPERPTVTVPSPLPGRRWEFMLLRGESEEDLLQGGRARQLIRQAGGPFAPQITRSVVYTFHAASAAGYSRGRVFLLGDAAHMMPPFGGQGMNCGLRDAHNLCWKLWLVLQGLAHPALLDTYSLERRQHTKQLIRLSTFLGTIVMPTSKPLALLRDGIFHTLNTIPAVRRFLSEADIKPQPRYTKGFMLFPPIWTRLIAFLTGAPRTGAMLPQPEIVLDEGKKVLLDTALGPGFALLRLHNEPRKAFASLQSDIWQRLDVRFVAMQNRVEHFPLRDPNLFVLVRPDRYVLGVFKESQEGAFAACLQRHLFKNAPQHP
ncbi:MAG TPA: FAD-dependent monooxygenase [Ktedonobacteraceae bacterium]|nr:FAD-dependent monooxygenase [Ktedonobacteraceae bacterium]